MGYRGLLGTGASCPLWVSSLLLCQEEDTASRLGPLPQSSTAVGLLWSSAVPHLVLRSPQRWSRRTACSVVWHPLSPLVVRPVTAPRRPEPWGRPAELRPHFRINAKQPVVSLHCVSSLILSSFRSSFHSFSYIVVFDFPFQDGGDVHGNPRTSADSPGSPGQANLYTHKSSIPVFSLRWPTETELAGDKTAVSWKQESSTSHWSWHFRSYVEEAGEGIKLHLVEEIKDFCQIHEYLRDIKDCIGCNRTLIVK